MYDQLLANIAILVLAGFVGFAVISKVPNTLHTPLMSGTNAIHGIVVLGALIVLGEPARRRRLGSADHRVRRADLRHPQRDRWLPGHRPHAEHVQGPQARGRGTEGWGREVTYLVNVLYIVAFGLFILGLSGLTGPKTAVRGNWIAAAGMGIAVVATLI